MITREQIQSVADEIVRRFSPRRVILFGSQATGKATEDSDVDLVVTMDVGESVREWRSAVRQAIRPNFACDLLVYDDADLDRRAAGLDPIPYEATHHGVTLYDSDHDRVGGEVGQRPRRRESAGRLG